MLIKNLNKIGFYLKRQRDICFQLQLDCIETNKINRLLCDYVTVESQTIMKLPLLIAFRGRE